ncbi:hypothetical protein LX16_2333 [Stackebrandtia albiflava]|uniref:Uncharacterized protein n=1 Tax=Stackebrandtia albiflava TaxID=406432 RepID=A0A562V1C8_9ACTN|nr:hypothetical protein [Stackebrandtia albiflava]TWJ11607.1 hypothetical protein LX16_2333 [Stackebrandtia albiflava]
MAAVAAAVTVGMMSSGNAFAEGEGDSVVFNGHCGLVGLGLAHESKPDKSELSVTEGDEVTFVNNLGTDATLFLGKQEIEVPEDDEYTTTLSASSEALMAPDCPAKLSERAETVTVTVTAAPATSDDQGSNGNGSPSTGDTGDTTGTGDDSALGVPDDGDQPPLDATDPAAKDQVPAPDGEKDDDGTSSGEEAVGTDTGDTAGTDETATNVEAVDSSTIEQTGASGVLALLATVCLVGVAVAAIRTLMTQRAAARG